MINAKAYTEVNAIIKSMPPEMQNQIPENLRKTIEHNMDQNYLFEIEEIEEVALLEDTEKILSVLYTDYFATAEERKIILAKEKILESKKDLEKQQKYPTDFLKGDNKQNTINIKDEEKSLVVKKEKFYICIFQKIKQWLGLT